MEKRSQAQESLLRDAFDVVQAFGSPEASRHAAQIQHSLGAATALCEQLPARTTLSEAIENAREGLRGAEGHEARAAVIASLPDCAEKHYMLAVLALSEIETRSIPAVAREEIERAWSMDPKNPVYEELIRMIHEELTEMEADTRRARDKQRGIVQRLARRVGLE